MKLSTPPPKKLSELLALAIADVARLDRQRYTPLWSTWHRPRPTGQKCMICLAGAVIAGTLECAADRIVDIASTDTADPQSVTITHQGWMPALRALDWAREGCWIDAVQTLTRTCLIGELRTAVACLTRPRRREFHNWEDLDIHMASLATPLRELRRLGL